MLLHILLNSEKLLAEIKIAQTKQSISVYEHSQKNTPYIEKRSPYETTFVLHYSQMPIFFVKHQLLRLHSCAGKIIGICIKRRIFREVRVSEQMRECAYSAYAIERICDRNDVIRGKDKPYYSMIPATTPDPTVRPPSRIANLSPSSIAIGVIRLIVIVMLSPGMHISTPSGS